MKHSVPLRGRTREDEHCVQSVCRSVGAEVTHPAVGCDPSSRKHSLGSKSKPTAGHDDERCPSPTGDAHTPRSHTLPLLRIRSVWIDFHPRRCGAHVVHRREHPYVLGWLRSSGVGVAPALVRRSRLGREVKARVPAHSGTLHGGHSRERHQPIRPFYSRDPDIHKRPRCLHVEDLDAFVRRAQYWNATLLLHTHSPLNPAAAPRPTKPHRHRHRMPVVSRYPLPHPGPLCCDPGPESRSTRLRPEPRCPTRHGPTRHAAWFRGKPPERRSTRPSPRPRGPTRPGPTRHATPAITPDWLRAAAAPERRAARW
mmetsp:Transcript_54281/g.129358  ORF Transcript_54281/g.129358 Transcript_54281/m.129358 type:complete len:312 (-) Transcript_54281:30-965(-)